MKQKIILAFLLPFLALAARAQDWQHAASLRSSLSKTGADTAKINILLQLAEFEIFKPGEQKPDLDSASVYLQNARNINGRIRSPSASGRITFVESYLAKEKGDLKKGKALTEKAIGILQKGTDKYYLGRAYFAQAEYYNPDNSDQLTLMMQAIERGINVFMEGGYTEKAAYGYRMLGELDNNDVTSLQRLHRSLALYHSIRYKQLQGLYDLIGNVYLYRTDFKQALTYYLKALKTAREQNDTSMQLCTINNHIGIVYYKLSEFENAIRYCKTALVIAESYRDIPTIYLLTANISNAYQKLGKTKEVLAILRHVADKYQLQRTSVSVDCWFSITFLRAYTTLKEYDQARRYSDHLLKIINSSEINKTDLSDSYATLITYFFATRQYSQQLIYLVKNEVLARELGISTNIAINHLMWFKLDTARKNYRDAVYHLLKYQQITDSTFTIAKNKELQRLQIQFDTKQKEDQINILNQSSQIQSGKLQRSELTKNVTIGGAALLIVIMALLYRQYRQKQATSQLINRKNLLLEHLLTEKKWLLKEVHHRVKNNLQTIICLLESQAAYLKGDARLAVENSEHRIYAMSLIHQKLYQTDDIKTIDTSSFLTELIRYLSDSFGISHQIHFDLNIESIPLSISQAIPISLIVNEAVTNSIKYAFPNQKKGSIRVEIFLTGEKIQLIISDNGIGIDPDIANTRSDSLGIKLMKGLSEDIHGDISFENDNGTKITISFNVDQLKQTEDVLTPDYELDI